MGFSVYFFTTAGLQSTRAFNLSLGQYGIGIIGTIISWMLMTYAGRRSLYLYGLITLNALLMVAGFISIAPASTSMSWATGSMLLAFALVYNASVGPVCYSLVNELPSTRLRVKTVALARSTYNICSIFNGIIIPYMLNSAAWNWAGRAGYFWAGICFLCVVYTFFRLPEPTGRTYAELGALFKARVSARKFAETHVDPFYEAGLAKEPAV